MFTKRKILLGSYYLPGVVVIIRVVFTLWVLISNPMGLRLPYFQLIPLGVMLCSCFGHFKLYRDSVPIISLVVPTLLQGVLIFVFFRQVMVVEFLPVFIPDILYLIVKAVKANLFPFYMEGEEDDELEELLQPENDVG